MDPAQKPVQQDLRLLQILNSPRSFSETDSSLLSLLSIDLNEAEQSVEDFDCFNAFFTRKLRQGSGLAEDPNALLCPVDGTLGEYGIIRDGNLLQAKDWSIG